MNGDLVSLDDALARVLRRALPLPSELVPLARAGGCYLAEAAVAACTHPAADNAAMDGYAVRAADLSEPGAELSVVGVSRTGHAPTAAVGAGQALRIFTGALLPDGADAVLVQEQATGLDGDRIRAEAVVPAGLHVRRAGEEFAQGETLLTPGTRLSPAAIGLLASAGVAHVAVPRPVRAALLVIGDELRDSGSEQLAHRYDSNGPMITAALAELGVTLAVSEARGDDVDAVGRWLADAVAECDLVLTCGSASVGDFDVVTRAWAQVPVAAEFGRVAIKPGKPVRFGCAGRVLVFALPGNPLACLTGFEQFVAPAVRRLRGGAWQEPPRVRLPLAGAVRTGHDAAYLLRSGVADGRLAVPARQGAAMLREAATQGLVARLAGGGTLAAGTPAEATALPGALDGLTLRPVGRLPRVVSIRASGSGVGKTLLIEALLAELTAAGLRCGTIKHAHHMLEPDTPGKDTHRHFAAGATRVLLLAPGKSALFSAPPESAHGPAGWLELFADVADLVLIEGYRDEPLPAVRIEPGERFGWTLDEQSTPPLWLVTRPAEPGPHWLYPPELVAELAQSLREEL